MKKPNTYFHSTFSRWVIPYILLIVVTICFGVLLYHQALKTVEEDVELIWQASLSRIQEQMDELLDSLDLLGYSICSSMEGTVLKQMAEGTYSVLQREHSRGLQEELKIWCASYDVLSELIVYFPNTGYLLGRGRFCPLEWAEQQLPIECGMDWREIKESAASGKNGLHIAKGTGEGVLSERLVYLYPSGASWRGQTEILVLFTLDTVYMKHLLSMPDSDIYLELLGEERWLAPKDLPKREQSAQYEKLSQTCRREDLTVVSLLEIRKYQKTVSVMRWLLVFYLIGGLGMGSACAWLITRKNYAPVRELRQVTTKLFHNGTVHKESGKEEIASRKERNFFLWKRSSKREQKEILDDIEAVRAAFLSLTRAYEEGKSLLRQEKQDRDNGRMNQLLKQKLGVIGSQVPTDWKEACPEEWFALMSVEILDFAEFAEKDGTLTSEMMGTAYFVVENVLSELVQQEALSYIGAATDGKWFLLANVEEKEKEQLEEKLKEIAERLCRVLDHSFAMPISVNISSTKKGWERVRECYQEIGELLEYRSFSGMEEAKVASYHDCLKRESEEKPEEEGSLMDQVVAYIEEHYTDNSLTVGALAKQFGVGLSWLSRNFKQQKEIGLLEYINRLRLEKAKSIIQEGKPIKEVAIAVGYTDTQPLNRMFRQLIGMTPTEYRTQYQAEQEAAAAMPEQTMSEQTKDF